MPPTQKTAPADTDATASRAADILSGAETGLPSLDGEGCMTPAQAQKRLARTIRDARLVYSAETTAAKVKRDKALAAAYAAFAEATTTAAQATAPAAE
jgi:hypothetical protein